MPDEVSFTVVLRGYNPVAVQALLLEVRAAVDSGDPAARARVRDLLADVTFPVRLRGYDRVEVDDHLARLAASLA